MYVMNIDEISVLQESFQQASETFLMAIEFEPEQHPSEDLKRLFISQLEQWEAISEQVSELEILGLFDIIQIFSEVLAEWIEKEEPIHDEIWEVLDNWYSHFELLFEQSTLLDAFEQLIYCLQAPCWEIELDDELAAELFISFISTDPSDAHEFTPFYKTESLPQKIEEEPAIEQNTTKVQAKLVNLMSTEFSFFVGEFSQHIDNAVATNEKNYQSAINNKLRKLNNLQEACHCIGLNGLQSIFQYLGSLLKQAPKAEYDYQLEARLLKSSLLLIQDYLDHVNKSEKAQALVFLLQQPGWRTTASTQQAQQWLASLTVTIEQPHKAEVQRLIAQQEDISLNLSSSIDADVLETTLHELQQLTANFHQVVASFTSKNVHLDSILTAQRIAHTLKGTAGIIGISGIMELTHHLESILEKLSEHNRLPPRVLAELFQESADCLSTMCEAVRGEDTPPPNALALLQSVLDWTYQIDKEGIPDTDDCILKYTTPLDKGDLTTDAPKTDTSLAQPVTDKTAVSSTIIDQLMQSLAEESIINEQLKGTVDTLITNTKQVRMMSWKLLEFSSELDRLVNIQNYTIRQKSALFDTLEMDQYNELNTYVNRITEVSADIKEINVGMNQQLNSLKNMVLAQDTMQKENLSVVREIRLLPAEKIASRCQRIVRQAAKITGKEVQLKLVGMQTLMDSDTLNKLMDPLMHLLRNAVDHGIEHKELRLSANKPPEGKIILSFAKQGNAILVSCRDDGQGLNREKIIQTAIQKSLISTEESQKMTENELSRLILRPGFTTQTTSTQLSGRGLGMDVIYSQVIAMRGMMEITSTPYQGMQVDMTLPVLLAATQAILVRVGTSVYAIAEQGIQQMFASSYTKIIEKEGQAYYCYEDRNYAIEHLSILLGHCSEVDISHFKKPALLVSDRTGKQHVIFVDAIIGSQDLIIKSLGDYVAHIPGVLGAAILGSGELAVVLDIYELLSIQHEHQFAEHDVINHENTLALPKILVIDDSLSARKATAQFMLNNSFDVETAIDGLDGLEKIEEKRPDLILVDMEMPRMDGVELTAHIRNRADLASIPIIMISSRTTEKHRERAKSAGVNSYLTKPFTEDKLISVVDDILEFVY